MAVALSLIAGASQFVFHLPAQAPFAHCQDIPRHPNRIAHQTHLAPGCLMPRDGHFLKLAAIVMQCREQFDIEGKPMDVQAQSDVLIRSVRNELESALAVVDGNVQQGGDERAKDTTDEPALPLPLHLGSRLIPSRGKQRRLWCRLSACTPDEMGHFSGGA